MIIVDSESGLEYKKRLFSMERDPSSYNQMLKHGLIGKSEEIATRVREYANMQISQFLLAFQDPDRLQQHQLTLAAPNFHQHSRRQRKSR